MISGYEQDDKSCAYSEMHTIIDADAPNHPSCALFVDKEEVGSVGATAVSSMFFENCVLELLTKTRCIPYKYTACYEKKRNAFLQCFPGS